MDCNGVRRLYLYNLENWLLLKYTPPAAKSEPKSRKSLLLHSCRLNPAFRPDSEGRH